MKLASLAFAAVSVAALLGACGSDDERQCRIGADCASGVCSAEGECVGTSPPPGIDASGSDAQPAGDGGAPTDGGADVKVPGCVPNKDGMITREEAPVGAGLRATYKIASNVDLSTAGTGSGSARVWDYATALTGDATVVVETLPLAGTWYGSKFPGATYATKLSNGSDLLGVFESSPGPLLLRGVVSPTDAVTTKTELQNAPGVSVLDFPLTVGKTWTSAVKVSGVAQGVTLFGTYDETYVNKVDAAGTLKTPLGTFDVMRVQVVLTRQIGILLPVTVRTYAFVTECYGTIATITSDQNEANVEFTHAAEIRRIAP